MSKNDTSDLDGRIAGYCLVKDEAVEFSYSTFERMVGVYYPGYHCPHCGFLGSDNIEAHLFEPSKLLLKRLRAEMRC